MTFLGGTLGTLLFVVVCYAFFDGKIDSSSSEVDIKEAFGGC